jgi:ligand-binding sensor domain-containing protein
MANGIVRALRGKLALLLCLGAAQPAWAISLDRSLQQLHHTAWLARDGAPDDFSSLSYTSDGFLWMGSSAGIIRFDGVTTSRCKASSPRRMSTSPRPCPAAACG